MAATLEQPVSISVVELDRQFSHEVGTALEGAALTIGPEGAVVTTPGAAGAPAAVFPRLAVGPPTPSSSQGYVVRVTALQRDGESGILLFDRERRSLGEAKSSVTGEQLTADFFVPDLAQCEGLLIRNLANATSTCELRRIQAFAIHHMTKAAIRPVPSPAPSDPDYDLHKITVRPFAPHANRQMGRFFSITTTEVCNLSCV